MTFLGCSWVNMATCNHCVMPIFATLKTSGELEPKMRPVIASGIVTGDGPFSYWPICCPVPSNSPRSLCESWLAPVSPLFLNSPIGKSRRALRSFRYLEFQRNYKKGKTTPIHEPPELTRMILHLLLPRVLVLSKIGTIAIALQIHHLGNCLPISLFLLFLYSPFYSFHLWRQSPPEFLFSFLLLLLSLC